MPEAAPADGPRILLLEDEWLIAEATAHSLRRLGYQTLGPAHSVSDASDVLATATPDAALIDTVLSRESSLPIADRLTELGIPFAFYSGFERSDLPERFKDCRFLRKPIGEAALKAELEALLATARARG
ncbi:response regulator [Roseomonas hellenica]|uniref:Response regulator n=1 Tax=Plastoroseomonas hellenica TaxID=2687306 RepID=A0ABS5F843_9PROT|nr:hypothetical protein [Plastoroseomonas hellenica]MBR0668603.1 response regulator [Plastoroseomonas hellenica]